MKEDILKLLENTRQTHISRRELAELLDVPADDKRAFRQAVHELLNDGVLLKVKKNYYAIRGRARVITGKLQAHRAGFGFLLPDPDCHPGADVYIAATHLGDATHGDRVMVQLLDTPAGGRPPAPGRGPRLEGRVLRVLERGTSRIVGRYMLLRTPVVIPLDSRYHYSVHPINTKDFPLSDGDVVHVELTTEPSARTRPQGRILSLVGRPDDPDLPFKITLAKHDIPVEFDPGVLAEARRVAVPVPPEEAARREDFRHLPAVTIDGETAFDFDDAVNAVKNPDGSFTLWVHIADVSHYVRPGGDLDREAFRRGTSVYFPGRAIPMLPDTLSSDICSLRPGEDRLAFTAMLTIDGRTGQTRAARFTPSVIRSRARMTYTQVAGILDGDAELRRQFASLVPEFEILAELTKALNRRRRARGAIDFDLPESEIRYDPDANILGIFKSERNFAHRLIEECMLAANEAVAGFFAAREMPFIYRIHEPPDPVKVEEFASVAGRFGHPFEVKEDEPYEPRDFQRVADTFGDTAVGRYLSYLMLRSFKLAVYSERNAGHFGLGAKDYTHFTSPIRRYPDLVVHRLLRAALASPPPARSRRKGAPAPDTAGAGLAELAEIAVQSSERERAAVEAEREIMAWQKALFMQSRLGQEFEGFISGIKPNGFFVELTEFFLEGFVNLSTLQDDFYILDEERQCFRGERTGRVFQLGTRLVVRVDRVDMDRYQIDFSVDRTLDEGPARPAAPGRKGLRTVKTRRKSRRPAVSVTEAAARKKRGSSWIKRVAQAAGASEIRDAKTRQPKSAAPKPDSSRARHGDSTPRKTRGTARRRRTR
jgi:ribonuclease R